MKIVRIYHREGLNYFHVFTWKTNKAGNFDTVRSYVFEKFTESLPKGYDQRSLRKNDRFEIEDIENSEIKWYEVVSNYSTREL